MQDSRLGEDTASVGGKAVSLRRREVTVVEDGGVGGEAAEHAIGADAQKAMGVLDHGAKDGGQRAGSVFEERVSRRIVAKRDVGFCEGLPSVRDAVGLVADG